MALLKVISFTTFIYLFDISNSQPPPDDETEAIENIENIDLELDDPNGFWCPLDTEMDRRYLRIRRWCVAGQTENCAKSGRQYTCNCTGEFFGTNCERHPLCTDAESKLYAFNSIYYEQTGDGKQKNKQPATDDIICYKLVVDSNFVGAGSPMPNVETAFQACTSFFGAGATPAKLNTIYKKSFFKKILLMAMKPREGDPEKLPEDDLQWVDSNWMITKPIMITKDSVELYHEYEASSHINGGCADNWTYYNNKCYGSFSIRQSMERAQHFCRQHEAELTSIESSHFIDFLSNQLAKVGVCEPARIWRTMHDISCYMIIPGARNFVQTKTFCSKKGGHITTIDDQEELEYLHNETQKLAVGDWWTGLFVNKDGQWENLNGEVVTYLSNLQGASIQDKHGFCVAVDQYTQEFKLLNCTKNSLEQGYVLVCEIPNGYGDWWLGVQKVNDVWYNDPTNMTSEVPWLNFGDTPGDCAALDIKSGTIKPAVCEETNCLTLCEKSPPDFALAKAMDMSTEEELDILPFDGLNVNSLPSWDTCLMIFLGFGPTEYIKGMAGDWKITSCQRRFADMNDIKNQVNMPQILCEKKASKMTVNVTSEPQL